MGHADADAVHDKFEELPKLSMDVPIVNWKVFRLMQEDVQMQTGKKLLNVRSCDLHEIHNSFRDRCSAVILLPAMRITQV